MGITRKTLARWRNVSPWWDLPKSEVQKLSRTEAGRIYRAGYWNLCRADDMPPGLHLALFDYAVNSGPDRAIRALQAVLGVVVDGLVGPLTIGAAARANATNVVNALYDRRLGFLKGLATFSTFGRGWTTRVGSVRAASLAATSRMSSSQKEETQMDILSGYKTYIVAVLMLLAGIAQMLGLDMPAMEGSSSGSLMLEALAILFLRRGLKGDIGKA